MIPKEIQWRLNDLIIQIIGLIWNPNWATTEPCGLFSVEMWWAQGPLPHEGGLAPVPCYDMALGDWSKTQRFKCQVSSVEHEARIIIITSKCFWYFKPLYLQWIYILKQYFTRLASLAYCQTREGMILQGQIVIGLIQNKMTFRPSIEKN